jgi:hypothetical protein
LRLENAHAAVPTRTSWTPALVKKDISVEKINTDIKTVAEIQACVFSGTQRRINTGMIKIPTASNMVKILVTTKIFVSE